MNIENDRDTVDSLLESVDGGDEWRLNTQLAYLKEYIHSHATFDEFKAFIHDCKANKCPACKGHGYLVACIQTGKNEILTIQRCDSCEKFNGDTPAEQAALRHLAAILARPYPY